MVSLGVDAYTKIPNQRKIFENAKRRWPCENQKNSKTKKWTKWGPGCYI